MDYSIKTRRFAYSLVATYCKFNTDLQAYDLDWQDVADFDLHELSALIMADNVDLANEANSIDNPNYESKMLPALQFFMMNSTDRDREIEFTKSWRDGVADYLKMFIQEVLKDALENYNYNNLVAA